MLAWLKKFCRPVAPRPKDVPSELEISKSALDSAVAKFAAALEEYRIGTIKLDCRRADREQRQRIRDCLETKHL